MVVSVVIPEQSLAAEAMWAQRMFCARDEKKIHLAQLYGSNIAHYAIRPWPLDHHRARGSGGVFAARRLAS